MTRDKVFIWIISTKKKTATNWVVVDSSVCTVTICSSLIVLRTTGIYFPLNGQVRDKNNWRQASDWQWLITIFFCQRPKVWNKKCDIRPDAILCDKGTHTRVMTQLDLSACYNEDDWRRATAKGQKCNAQTPLCRGPKRWHQVNSRPFLPTIISPSRPSTGQGLACYRSRDWSCGRWLAYCTRQDVQVDGNQVQFHPKQLWCHWSIPSHVT